MFRKRGFWIVAVWLIVWQLVSFICNNSIMVVGPWETVLAILQNLLKGEFWKTVLLSCARIWSGMIIGVILGAGLAAAGYRYTVLKEILAPFLTLVKAIPVASFAVLLLIWWGSEHLSAGICMLVVLPHIYVNMLQGFEAADEKLLEMAKAFRMPLWNRFFYIYRPGIEPFWNSAVAVAVGMAWKSGVAAQVIGLPENSVGESLYMAKIYLETADVFAWTAVTILLSYFTEKVIKCFGKVFFSWQPVCKACPVSEVQEKICVNAVSCSFHGEEVVKNWSEEYEKGKVYYYRTASGSGKTTKLRLLAGLIVPDEGSIKGSSVSMVFQEDRLCDGYSAVKNVEMVTGDADIARKELSRILPGECLDRPCRELSGGMQRRVALVRAMVASSQFCLLDEPFNGLDEESRHLAQEYIVKESCGRGIIIASHEREIN